MLAMTAQEFSDCHPDLSDALTEHGREVVTRLAVPDDLPLDRQRLIGAYFTMEYAFESAALFNPSMVRARDQRGAAPGSVRFLMSLRAVGEGHISSIVFRYGTIDADGEVDIDPAGRHAWRIRMAEDPMFEKGALRMKVAELGAYDPAVESALERLDGSFSLAQLLAAIRSVRPTAAEADKYYDAAASIEWVARSSYQLLRPDPDANMGELVLYPLGQTESHGMEDMRLVRFVDGADVRYYGTYTAFDGRRILPQLLESSAPDVVRIYTLSGRFARNKGMALFPRKIDGAYAMVARVDGESLYLLRSDNVLFWEEGIRIQEPEYAWEFVQIGNCGSPIETDAGWLLLTHGVGPMRRYCISAMLLDRADPARVLGRLDEPLIVPTDDERSGYVPNVVYSCGSMVHNGHLVIPYGISDAGVGFAVVPLADLLQRLCP